MFSRSSAAAITSREGHRTREAVQLAGLVKDQQANAIQNSAKTRQATGN